MEALKAEKEAREKAIKEVDHYEHNDEIVIIIIIIIIIMIINIKIIMIYFALVTNDDNSTVQRGTYLTHFTRKNPSYLHLEACLS